MKAKSADVTIGQLTLPGLISEDRQQGISVPQLAEIGLVAYGRSLKQIETLTGLTFSSQKWATPLNSKAVNVLTLPDVERLILALVARKSESAIALWNQGYPDKAIVSLSRSRQTSKQGYLYLLEGSNLLKFGYSTNVKQRMAALSRWDGELELLYQCQGTIEMEQDYHRILHNTGSSLGKEWYPLDRKQDILRLMKK